MVLITCRVKCKTIAQSKEGENGNVLLVGFSIIYEVIYYYMKVDYDTLIVHILNPRATPKKIKQDDIVSKSTVEIKWNTKKKKHNSCQKNGQRNKKGTKNTWDK